MTQNLSMWRHSTEADGKTNSARSLFITYFNLGHKLSHTQNSEIFLKNSQGLFRDKSKWRKMEENSKDNYIRMPIVSRRKQSGYLKGPLCKNFGQNFRKQIIQNSVPSFLHTSLLKDTSTIWNSFQSYGFVETQNACVFWVG